MFNSSKLNDFDEQNKSLQNVNELSLAQEPNNNIRNNIKHAWRWL